MEAPDANTHQNQDNKPTYIPDNDSGRQAEAESQRAGLHGGRRQDVAQGGKHPEAATGEKNNTSNENKCIKNI